MKNPLYPTDIHPLHRPTWCEVDLQAVAHNYRVLKKLAGFKTEMLPVIKGDAYGHGMLQVASILNDAGVKFFGVSDVEEGVLLRQTGFTQKILLFESTLPQDAPLIAEFDLIPTICTLELAKELNRYARSINRRIAIHVEVDTGMGRLGLWHEEAVPFISKVLKDHHCLSIEGIYTHFPVAEADPEFTRRQIQKLDEVVSQLDRLGLVVPYIHAANSMGIVKYQSKTLNLARPGLMLYGLHPNGRHVGKVRLKPVLSVKSQVMFVKRMLKGRSISYGRTFVAPRTMTIATLAIGYRDGYFRSLSNRAFVLIKGEPCPVVGRVTMDQIMVDVSHLKGVKPGIEAVIMGRQGQKEVSADDLAQWADTISYEIVTSLGSGVARIYKSRG